MLVLAIMTAWSTPVGSSTLKVIELVAPPGKIAVTVKLEVARLGATKLNFGPTSSFVEERDEGL